MRTLRLGLAQLNPTVGDLEGNGRKILEYLEQARSWGADLVAFPELAITGYPPEDLLLKPSFVRDNLRQIERVAGAARGLTAVIGFVAAEDDLYNAAAVVHDGQIVQVCRKALLPTYGVFDEDRYFRAGGTCPVLRLNGVGVGVNICEDIWYPTGPASEQSARGAEVIVNISASPYHMGKRRLRETMLATRAMDSLVVVAHLNTVGGQDELVFDGSSVVFGPDGRLMARASQFEEELLLVDVEADVVFRTRLHDPRRRKEKAWPGGDLAGQVVLPEVSAAARKPPLPSCEATVYEGPAEVYQALVLGTRDYVRKNGFRRVVLGLSGGIDSSLVACIAVDALGAESVVGVSMPSRYSSEGSRTDAQALAENLGIEFLTIPIEGPFQALLDALAGPFRGLQPNVAEENLQARVRGTLLMALSNKFGWLVLATGNKSEMATGYATLYGDMAGGLAVIKDVPKTLVYELARYRNSVGPRPVIPESVLVKEPSAELRFNQRDVDSLPPYELLDPVLKAYVEEDRSYDEIVAMGFDPDLVRRVVQLVDRNEYKRRQAPPGIKVTPRAFGRDRRLPITNGYRSC
ncbi:MAG TPA: NAD+ synthase [Chloroflexota bacterium]